MEENLSSLGKTVRDKMKTEQARQRRIRDNVRWKRFIIDNF